MRAGIVAKESAACLVCEAINSLAADIKNKDNGNCHEFIRRLLHFYVPRVWLRGVS